MARKIGWCLSVLFLSLCLWRTSAAQTLDRVAISQVVDRSPALKTYLDVRNSDNTPVSALTATSVQATLEGKPLPILSMRPFSDSNEAIAYVMLVDISKSESRSQFARVQAALQEFVNQMNPQDRAAVVSFGNTVKTEASYTGDKAELKRVISGLTNDASMTHLNSALLEGLHIARRQDRSLPDRRSILILSDGKDEGSGLTEDDVLRELQENRIPIYAVGASTLSKPDRQKYLEVLHRYALLSGGAYYEALGDKVGAAYSQIHDQVAQVWIAQLNCASCTRDGRSYPLQVQVTSRGQMLSDKLSLSLVAVPTPTHAQVAPWWKRLPLAAYIGGGAAVALLLVWLIVAISHRKTRTSLAQAPPPDPIFTPLVQDPLPGVVNPPILAAEDTRPGAVIELIRRDRQSASGAIYSAKLIDRLIVGRSAEAQLRLPDSSISNQHCELELLSGRVMVSDAESTYGTFLNGVPVKSRQRLESGDVLALGTVEFRVDIRWQQ